jgi:hypothetical protein
MKKALINLINKWACCHDWQTKKEIEVECDGGTLYHKFIFVCKKCGKFKTLNSRKI